MPLFFFHLRTGDHLDEDTIGVDLLYLEAARREGFAALGDMLRDAALTGRAVRGGAFEVTDRDGRNREREGPMPRYYLNVRRRGELIEDPDGEEAADLPAIRRVAEDTIEDILRRPETYGENQNWDRCTFVITDESGAVAMELPFSEFAV